MEQCFESSLNVITVCYSNSHYWNEILPICTKVDNNHNTRVPSLIDNEGGVKLRMLHLSFGNLVLSLLRNIEVHGAMSETGASQPLNCVGGLRDCRQFPAIFRLIDCTCQFVTRFDVEFHGPWKLL